MQFSVYLLVDWMIKKSSHTSAFGSGYLKPGSSSATQRAPGTGH